MNIGFSTKKRHAFLAYIVKKWHDSTGEGVGRTQLQKLCYFARAKGVPLSCQFTLYHYGPFSKALYDSTDSLILDRILADRQRNPDRSEYVPGDLMEEFLGLNKELLERYELDLDSVVELFEDMPPRDMELMSTVHYVYRALKDNYERQPTKDEVISSAFQLKGGKFSEKDVGRTYRVLKKSGLLHWGNASN